MFEGGRIGFFEVFLYGFKHTVTFMQTTLAHAVYNKTIVTFGGSEREGDIACAEGTVCSCREHVAFVPDLVKKNSYPTSS